MNLNINYLPNSTGIDIAQGLADELSYISTREVKIAGLDYLEISIKDEDSNNKRTLNTVSSIINSLDSENMSKILSLNGIASDFPATETAIRQYEVLICDLKIISIRLTILATAKSKEKTRYIRETENSKIADMSKRALYLSGLDLGLVTVILTSKRRLMVRALDSSPIVREKDLANITDMIVELYGIENIVENREIKLGADPEFMLFNAKNGKMIAASEFFPKDGLVGCDNIRLRSRQQRPIAEIRPKPDDCPLELIENIKLALASAGRLAPYKNVKWVAGSQPMNGYPIGGHIHFSKIKISGTFLRALDNYLGIPIFLIEDPILSAKRRKKYGLLGEYRVKDHGGFEYRTPSSWLVSQKIATAILCLAKIVASRYPYLPKNYLNSLEAQEAFYNGNQAFFVKYFYVLWGNIENTDLYKSFEEELKIIPELIMNGLTWDEKSDFRKSWKITTSSKTYSRKPVNQQIITNIPSAAAPSRRTASTATRNTRISVNRAGGTSRQSRASSSTNINQRANISSGRIIGSGQVRRSQRVR